MIYEYASDRVIFGSGILGFGFNSDEIESGRNRFKTGTVRVAFGLSIFGLLQFGSLRFGFELGRVISGVGNVGSCYNSGLVRLWIGLLWVFRSKSVHPISGVGSGMDPGHSVRVSGLGSQVSFARSNDDDNDDDREWVPNNKIYRIRNSFGFMIYEYGSVRVIIGSGILGFGFNLG